MADTTYRVVAREDGSFVVEIVSLGALPQTAAGFATEAEAKGWIAHDKRLRGSAEIFGVSTGRRWHTP